MTRLDTFLHMLPNAGCHSGSQRLANRHIQISNERLCTMQHPYKTREGGATVTVFVPYDCKNHCPFCINKEEYANTTDFSLEKICESIRLMDKITPRCDFVFTGGEPFANLEAFQVMLDAVPPTHKIYISTQRFQSLNTSRRRR